MPTNPSPERRRSARGSSRPASRLASRPAGGRSQLPFVVGGAVVLVVVLVFVLNRGGSQPANAGTSPEQSSAPPAAAAPARAPIQLGSAKAGKAPAVPAPPLTTATLQELETLLERIKTLRNEAVTARTGDADIEKARAKMGEAKVLLDQWVGKVEAALQWQERAEMEDWAQPAEYVALEKIYSTYSRYANEVRKGGG
jgi:hypothetical protein